MNTQTHPTLTEELINDIVLDPIPTLDLCNRHGLTIPELHALLESPEFQHLIAHLEGIDRLRAPILRRKSLEILERVAFQDSNSAETARKAAAQLARLTKPDEPAPTNTPGTPTAQEPAPEPVLKPTPAQSEPLEPIPHAPSIPSSTQSPPQLPPDPLPPDNRTPTPRLKSPRRPTPADLINAAGRPVSLTQILTQPPGPPSNTQAASPPLPHLFQTSLPPPFL